MQFFDASGSATPLFWSCCIWHGLPSVWAAAGHPSILSLIRRDKLIWKRMPLSLTHRNIISRKMALLQKVFPSSSWNGWSRWPTKWNDDKWVWLSFTMPLTAMDYPTRKNTTASHFAQTPFWEENYLLYENQNLKDSYCSNHPCHPVFWIMSHFLIQFKRKASFATVCELS